MLRHLWRHGTAAARSARSRGLLMALALALLAGGGPHLIDPAPAAAAPKPKHTPLPPTKMRPLPPAVIDDTLEIGGDAIDARKVSTRMTVVVTLNGHGPYRFVVDSGADTSVIGARAARALQLPAGTPVLLNGVTERAMVDRVRLDELGLGESTFHHLHLPVLKEQDLGGDGMIGIDALVRQRLMLDFEKRLITVEDARRPPERRYDGEIVVTARRRRGQLILTQVHANDKSVEAVVDTGTEITIGNLALRDKLFRRHPDKLRTVAVTGVTGVTVDVQLATLDELKLGPVVLANVPIAFADVPPFTVFGLADRPALMLGTDLMETFRRVSLDFRARKVRFQLRRCRNTGLVIATSPGTISRLSAAADGQAACKR